MQISENELVACGKITCDSFVYVLPLDRSCDFSFSTKNCMKNKKYWRKLLTIVIL